MKTVQPAKIFHLFFGMPGNIVQGIKAILLASSFSNILEQPQFGNPRKSIHHVCRKEAVTILYIFITTFWRQAMLINFRSILFVITSFFIMTVAVPALAADDTFADYKYVLHISDMDPSKQDLILNNASNLLAAYPPGAVEVEIVAYGPGLRLLFDQNANVKRIDSLFQSGVKFSACGVTLKGMTSQLGYEPKLNPDATVVPGGIVRIGELVKQGYIYVKP
ncbi:MAG: hypothetical protein ABI479_07670 [Gallionella sp.]